MEAKYRVFFVDQFDTVVRPFAIVTAYANPGGHPKAEWFLVIPGNADEVFGQVTRFVAQSFQGTPIALDEEFMLEEVSQQVDLKLRQYVFEKIPPERALEVLRSLRLVDGKEQTLAHYRLRDECSNQLQYIRDHTDCVPLRKFLDGILALDPIVRRGFES